MQIDPVCGMQVDEKMSQYRTEYKGKTYYFCAPACKKAFESERMGKKPRWKFW